MRLNEVFHRLLRENSESACDSCRWTLSEKLQNVEGLAKSLEKVVHEECNRGDCACGDGL